MPLLQFRPRVVRAAGDCLPCPPCPPCPGEVLPRPREFPPTRLPVVEVLEEYIPPGLPYRMPISAYPPMPYPSVPIQVSPAGALRFAPGPVSVFPISFEATPLTPEDIITGAIRIQALEEVARMLAPEALPIEVFPEAPPPIRIAIRLPEEEPCPPCPPLYHLRGRRW